MCGITGIITAYPGSFDQNHVLKMTDALAHRGPDGSGSWISDDGSVLFGHRRLSVIDLSEAAAQPMHYLRRYTIVYNGEIYNYSELREVLLKQGYIFRTASDTEVLLAAYDCWKENCLKWLDGMFAFAIWDDAQKLLFIARDRFGEKPFYYSLDKKNGSFFFASEYKALFTLLPRSINNAMLLNYLGLGQTSNPSDAAETFYNNINRLPPSTYINIPLALLKKVDYEPEPIQWWGIDKNAVTELNEKQASDRLLHLLTQSVRKRYRSDIGVGTSLSGGLDSSSIVSVSNILQENSNAHACFTAAFPGFEKDESAMAARVANASNCRHFITALQADDFAQEIERVILHHEEPIGSASVYAQYKVFELARKNGIQVLMDGQGADEILAGYEKYFHWYLQELLVTDKRQFHEQQEALIRNAIPFSWTWTNRLASRFPLLTARLLEKRAWKKIAHHADIAQAFRKAYAGKGYAQKPVVRKLTDLLHFNTFNGGLQELLNYADRNSMAHGCELRLPFLQHELTEFIFSLPSNFKIRDGYTKWLLRQAMQNSLPANIVWRHDKIGFEPPQEQWMQHKSVQDSIHFAKSKLVNERILNASVLDKKNQPQTAYAADNYDWRYLVSGLLLRGNS